MMASQRPLRIPFVLSFFALLAGIVLSVSVGPRSIPIAAVWNAFFQFDPINLDHAVVRDLRLPRAVSCILSGLGLATAGALMQGLIRNPIAGPSLLGLGSGASLAQVAVLMFAPSLLGWMRIEVCILGALVGAAIVFASASTSRGLVTPAKLALIGVNVSIFLAALANGLILAMDLPQEIVSWFSRGMMGIGWVEIMHALPWVCAGFAAALLVSTNLNILSLGDSAATGLGLRTHWVRITVSGSVIALAGTAYTFVGPVAFVGVLVPHAARAWTGLDYRRVIPCSGLIGAVFLLYADTGARLLEQRMASPLPVSLLCALVGAPCFLLLLSHQRSRRALGIV